MRSRSDVVEADQLVQLHEPGAGAIDGDREAVGIEIAAGRHVRDREQAALALVRRAGRREGDVDRPVQRITVQIQDLACHRQLVGRARHEQRRRSELRGPAGGRVQCDAAGHGRAVAQELQGARAQAPGIDRLAEDHPGALAERDVGSAFRRDRADHGGRSPRRDPRQPDPDRTARHDHGQLQLLTDRGGDRDRVEAAVHEGNGRRRGSTARYVTDPDAGSERQRARRQRDPRHRGRRRGLRATGEPEPRLGDDQHARRQAAIVRVRGTAGVIARDACEREDGDRAPSATRRPAPVRLRLHHLSPDCTDGALRRGTARAAVIPWFGQSGPYCSACRARVTTRDRATDRARTENRAPAYCRIRAPL